MADTEPSLPANDDNKGIVWDKEAMAKADRAGRQPKPRPREPLPLNHHQERD